MIKNKSLQKEKKKKGEEKDEMSYLCEIFNHVRTRRQKQNLRSTTVFLFELQIRFRETEKISNSKLNFRAFNEICYSDRAQ